MSLFISECSSKNTNTIGHRLKSANNKTSLMFHAFRTPRRIILSGTPIQNDLSEFHAMVGSSCKQQLRLAWTNFGRLSFVILACLVCPRLLPSLAAILIPFQDDYSTFRRVYEVPILKSRAPDSTAKDIELGETRTAQVSDLLVFTSFSLSLWSTVTGNCKKLCSPPRCYPFTELFTSQAYILIFLSSQITHSCG